MNPAQTTRSGRYDATVAVSAASQSARLGKSGTRCTKVSTPARSARRSPSMSCRSAPTATTWAPYAGSAAASSSAWRLVPEPETRTTRRAAGTAASLESGLPPHVPAVGPGRCQRADERTEAEGDHGVQRHLRGERADVLHPAGSDRTAGEGREGADDDAGQDAAASSRVRRPPPSGWSGRAGARGRRRTPPRAAGPGAAAPPTRRAGRRRAGPPAAGTSAPARAPPQWGWRRWRCRCANPGPSR